MKKRYAFFVICAALLLSGCARAGGKEESGEAENTLPVEAVQEESVESAEESTVAPEAESAEESMVAPEAGSAEESSAEAGELMQEEQEQQAQEETFAGNEVASPQETEEAVMEEAFYITEITDEIWERIKGKSYKDDCTLPREDLRYLHVLHVDAEGVEHEGEMICNVHIAETVLDILRQLYEEGYPIEKIRLVDEYDADDETSMRDNNSSSFNFRFISHSAKVSKHGLGLAVDINPLYNPYIKNVNGKRNIEPATAEPYLDRDADFPYKIEKGDLCYRLFTENGFEWGGNWKNQKDYQHFELPTSVVNALYP